MSEENQIIADAREYWALLASPANGWGQHIHPRYGQSHNMLAAMYAKHGEEKFSAALDETHKP